MSLTATAIDSKAWTYRIQNLNYNHPNAHVPNHHSIHKRCQSPFHIYNIQLTSNFSIRMTDDFMLSIPMIMIYSIMPDVLDVIILLTISLMIFRSTKNRHICHTINVIISCIPKTKLFYYTWVCCYWKKTLACTYHAIIYKYIITICRYTHSWQQLGSG